MSEEDRRLIEEMKDNCIKQANYVDVKAMNKYNALRNLQQENQQLKESYCNRTDCSGRLHDSRKYPSIKQQLDLYKSVLDEIREYIKELDDNTDDTTCYDIDRNVRDDLLQILDKVGKE